jgi:hypothetical protein
MAVGRKIVVMTMTFLMMMLTIRRVKEAKDEDVPPAAVTSSRVACVPATRCAREQNLARWLCLPSETSEDIRRALFNHRLLPTVRVFDLSQPRWAVPTRRKR